MSASKTKDLKGQAGFTLVELAVVMIIIGLLIGGVLKGQELIANAQITSTASTVKAFDAATTTFRDSYAAMPGDMLNPGGRLPNCAAAPCSTAGNGNNRVDTVAPSAAMTATSENLTFWQHLSVADLIGGINPALANAWGGNYPAAPIGGGFHVGYNGAGTLGANVNTRAGHYLALVATAGAAPAGTALTALQAARLDRKLDDGVPNTGTVFTQAATACIAAGAYAENNAGSTCDLYIRFQN